MSITIFVDPVKWDPILDQFSIITRPYPRAIGLKTIPFPAAHNRIANIWEYPPPPTHPWANAQADTTKKPERNLTQKESSRFGFSF